MPFKRNSTRPAGDYAATHTEIVEKVSNDGATFMLWFFETEDGGALSGTTSLNSGPASKANKWASAMLGRAPTADEFDEDLVVLQGRRCRLVVGLNEAGFNVIDAILPPAPPAGSAAAMQERLSREAAAASADLGF